MSDTACTLGDLIDLALRDSGVVGVGQTPLAEDTKRAVLRLDMQIKQWRRDRWMVWGLRTLSKVSTGAQTYTIGPSGDFDLSGRPEAIESAFIRYAYPAGAQVDYPLDVLKSMEEYNRTTLKTLSAPSSFVFLETAYPLGKLYFWPVPPASLYEMFVTVKTVLEGVSMADLATDLGLSWPGEYFQALLDVLSVRLREAYKLSPRPLMIAQMKKSLGVIRGANAQIAELQMPSGMGGSSRSYNIYSDN